MKKIRRKMKQTITIPEIFKKYNEALESAQKMNYLVRDSDLQAEEAKRLLELKNIIKSIKYQVIEDGEERLANRLFHLQCTLNSVISSLKMWISLKKGEYEAAWSLLIDAHEYSDLALKAIQGDEGHYGFEELKQHLDEIERVCFPGFPLYNSWGALAKGGKCSICRANYDKCEHIEGFIYMGRLCKTIEYEDLKLDHSALVTEPKDRRCIITKISTDEGFMRDYMTWKITDEPASEREDARQIQVVLYVNESIESN